MTDTALTLAAVAGGWVAFLWFAEFRTIRTVVLLSVCTAVLVLASGLQAPFSLLIAATVVLGLLLIHFRFNGWIAAHGPADRAFLDALVAINEKLAGGYESGRVRLDIEQLGLALVGAERDIEGLVAPGPEWEEVKGLALGLVRERLRLLDAGDASPQARARFESQRTALHERIRLAQVRTARFWR